MNALDLLYIPLAIVTAPFWGRKQRSGWGERMGKGAPVADRGRRRILLHAVSVGEVNALRELVPLLTPHAHVIVSVGTDTGIKRARELFSSACDVVRYPLDASWAVKRFLDRVRPDAAALVELEIWPNFVRACGARGVPVCVINGRLSARSFKGYRRLRWFFRSLFGALEFAAVQDAEYAARFEAMGVAENDCLITGSMKWDSARIEDGVAGAEELGREMGIARDVPLIVAGSTGPGEEELLMRVCAELESEVGPVQLLCAPRKPERFGEAAEVMVGCVRRTGARAAEQQNSRAADGAKGTLRKAGEVVGKTRGTEPPPPRRTAAPPPMGEEGVGGGGRSGGRFLLDTIGELRNAYALADVVVVGRSFGDQYGSDPIEPIGLGRATVIGPAVSDFAQVVAEFEKAGGIARARRENLREVLRGLLTDAAARRALAERGRQAIRAQQGASVRHAELLLSLVEESADENSRVSAGVTAR